MSKRITLERHIQHEWISIKGVVFSMSTTSIDWVTWTNAYTMGIREANHPLPVIPLQVVWPSDGHLGCVYIDDLRYGEDDPHMVRAWDFWVGKGVVYYWDQNGDRYEASID